MRAENEQHQMLFDVTQVIGPAGIVNNQIMVMETLAEMQARALCEWFREERTRIQGQLGEATTRQEFRKRFARLSLHTRIHKGTLEIYWTEVKGKAKSSAGGKTRWFMVRMPKGKRHSYDNRKLAAAARDYELALVLEAERRATALRDFWARIVALRLALRMINRQVDDLSVIPGPEMAAREFTMLKPVDRPQAFNEPYDDVEAAANAEFPQSALIHHRKELYD